MTVARASGKNIGIPPRKVRLVADLVRGKKVAEARVLLKFTRKASAPVIRKILESAVANAEDQASERRERIDTDEMVVSTILVNEGRKLHRWMPRARGRATQIRKRSSHIELTISDS